MVFWKQGESKASAEDRRRQRLHIEQALIIKADLCRARFSLASTSPRPKAAAQDVCSKLMKM